MQSILATLESSVSPEAINTPAKEGFNVGKATHAMSLLETFTADVYETTRLATLRSMVALTCEEFKQACKDALTMADTSDKLAGFVAPEGAKGQDNYGPARRVLSQRLSECKNIFGALKLGETFDNVGYARALDLSRKALKEKGLRWDGSSAPTDADKDAKLKREALSEAMKNNPQQAGESLGAWALRCEGVALVKAEEAKESAEDKRFAKLVEKEDTAALLTYLINGLDKDDLAAVATYIASITVS